MHVLTTGNQDKCLLFSTGDKYLKILVRLFKYLLMICFRILKANGAHTGPLPLIYV